MTGLLGLTGLSSPWIMIAGAGALSLAVASTTYWVTSRAYQTQIAQIKLERAETIAKSTQLALDQFTADWNMIHKAAESYQQTQKAIEVKFNDLQRALAQATAIPLGIDCTATAGRLSVLRDAIRATNDAATSAGLGASAAVRNSAPGTGTNIRRTAPVGH